MSAFKKAERSKKSLKMAITGPAGSGKTHSALKIAAGLAEGGRIFVADTENDRACLEAGKPGIPDFFVTPILPPFRPETFMNVMENALNEGARVLILDTLSHEWEGEGGILEQKEALEAAKPNANPWSHWSQIMPAHNRMKNKILAYPIHLIVTLRTKTEWVVHERRPVKVGLRPLQKEGIEYDFILVLNMDQESHTAQISKDSTSLFDGKGEFIPDQKTGETILEWMNQGTGMSPQQQHKASIEKLEEIKTELEAIADLDTLTDWFKANEVEIKEALAPDHWEAFLGYCKKLRNIITSRKWLEWAENKVMQTGNEWDLEQWRKKNEKNVVTFLVGDDRVQFEQLLSDKSFDLKTREYQNSSTGDMAA
jgi:hypothetical protein